jgi:radical SAM family uncharacterized protein/radical SAM-linked protein
VPVAVESLLTPEILKPARYLGNELGAAHKPWELATVRWSLTYPEIYEVGASNLGHIILYNIINAQPRQLCDRAYLPAPDLSAKLRETQTPLFAVESRRSLLDFDILGFSLSYELGATNILEMLSLAQVPLTWQERSDGGNYPLIFAGGQTATSNPEPYAEFFDFIALGDGEELLPEIGLIIEEGKAAGLSRPELLLDLAQVPGVYVPQFYDMAPDGSVHPNHPDVPKRILRRVATPIPAYSIGLVPYIQTVHDRLVIEIRRGCTRGCRFCQPGMLTRPARDVAPEQVIEAVEKGMRATGYNEFSLLSLSCSDYLALPAVGMEIKNRLKDENISLSLPSQRVDRFDENIANIIGGTRKGGLTFAPEAGTQRMRDIVNKGLTNEELLRGVKTAYEQGWDKIKLYFMIGLPGETDVDVIGIADTIRWLRRECSIEGRRRLDFNITISNFTPKPHTPFQWHSVSTSEFKRKQDILRAEFRYVKGVKVNFTDVRISAMEDFVGRGDRRLAPVVRRAWELGAGMDSWWENLDQAYGAWTQAIDESDLTWKYRKVESGEWNIMGDSGDNGTVVGAQGIAPSSLDDVQHSDPPKSPLKRGTLNSSPPLLRGAGGELMQDSEILQTSVYTTTQDTRLDDPLPWDHIDTGIDKQWLKDDLQRALEAATVPDCSFEGCSHCGVCSTDFGHNIVIQPPEIPVFAGEFVPNQARVQRLRVWFGKQGDMSLVSHLDLIRLFDRVVRRAEIPIAFTGGFHPGPRIAVANALSLGATSSGEIVDFELTRSLEPEALRQLLSDHLPETIPIYNILEVPLSAPSGTQAVSQADYRLTLRLEDELSSEDWQGWIDAVLASAELLFEQKAKNGKMKQINLRDRLHHLALVQTAPEVVLNYIGVCSNEGMLRPEHVGFMLESVSGRSIQLQKIHRDRLILADEG